MHYYSGTDLARNFRVVRKNTLQVAEDIPESQYGYRPTGESLSVGELLAHIAASTRWPHRLHGVDRRTFMPVEAWGAYMQDVAAFEKTLTTKPAIVQALRQEGDAFAGWLETLTDEQLGEAVRFPPPLEPSQKTRFEMLLGTKEHEMHHRAQLMVIERLIGIVPHLTRQRQQRQAQNQPQAQPASR
jgi:uncharacterized damage-inducible protein DinB